VSPENEPKQVHVGQHLSLLARGRWEFVTRNTPRPAVGIVAITQQGKVVLVEQYRPPVGCRVVEIPAGLTGDMEGTEDEALVEAAKRELLEETGYAAHRWTQLAGGYSSPGLTDESIVLFLAEELERQHAGGGVGDENITVHEVELDQVLSWLQDRQARADLKLFAGLYAAQQHLRSRTTD
jgi:ADP-ribose pyrophosphatase